MTARLEELAKRYRVTLNTVMQTLWGIVLGRYNGTQDVVFGSVVSGRPADIVGVEDMIGLFINTIPVRVSWEAEQRLADVLEEMQQRAVEMKAYDYVPLADIQGQSELKQGLFSHIMVFENYPMEESVKEAGEEALEIGDVSIFEQTNYDFNVTILPGKAMQVQFSYNAHVYDAEMVERLSGHLLQLIESAVSHPEVQIEGTGAADGSGEDGRFSANSTRRTWSTRGTR